MANKFSITQWLETGNIFTHAGSSLIIIITIMMGMDTLFLKAEN